MCPPSHNSSCAQPISTGSATAVTVTELVLPLLQQLLDCQTILSRHWAVGAAVPIKDTYALRQKFFAQQLLRFHGHSKQGSAHTGRDWSGATTTTWLATCTKPPPTSTNLCQSSWCFGRAHSLNQKGFQSLH